MAFNAKWLSGTESDGYGPRAIPDQLDDKIRPLLKHWIGLPDSEREAAAMEVSDPEWKTLLAFGERMASLAIREHNSEHLFYGLIAIGVQGMVYDWRENLCVLSVLVDALRRLESVSLGTFDRVLSLVSEPVAAEFRAFRERPGNDQAIGAFGYQTTGTGQSFRYIRTW